MDESADRAFTRPDGLRLEAVPEPEMKVGDVVTVVEPGGVGRFVVVSVEPAEIVDEEDGSLSVRGRKVEFRAI